jgi:hypothetical protein
MAVDSTTPAHAPPPPRPAARFAGVEDPHGSPSASALRATHAWFEVNGGWAPPDEATLADWVADDVCRCPDDCLVRPDGVCRHGLASWKVVLEAIALEDALTHRRWEP